MRTIDIRYRLIASFILVSLIPLFIFCGIFYMESSQALIAEVHTLRNKILSIGLIYAVFVLLLSHVVCRRISVPLGRLAGTMRATEDGNYHEELEALVAARTKALKEANLKLEALSLTDVLTGLANRRRLDEVLASELRRAIRSSQYLAVIMLDVDFFKKYNDCYGHQAGDDCLRKVADALQACCQRAGDLVARYGGEEFVLIVADADIAGTMALAETLRGAIEALRLPHCESEFGYVTVSIGVAVQKPAADHTAGLILGTADRAMYRAKLLGRNRVVSVAEERATELLIN